MIFGGEYVAASRVTDMEHLHLTRAVTADQPLYKRRHEKLRSEIRRDYERLQALQVPLDLRCADQHALRLLLLLKLMLKLNIVISVF